jgi:hypothetical protein
VLGSLRFQAEIEQALDRRMVKGRPDRLRAQPKPHREQLTCDEIVVCPLSFYPIVLRFKSRMAFSSGCLRENIKEHREEMTETARKHEHVPNGMVVWNALKGEKEYACRVA